MAEYPLTYYLANIVRRTVLFITRTTKGIDPNKVVFSCFGGRSYGDNTRIISERLHERCPNAKIIWQFSKDNLARLSKEVPDYAVSCMRLMNSSERTRCFAPFFAISFKRYGRISSLQCSKSKRYVIGCMLNPDVIP